MTAALDWDGERGVLNDRLADTSTRRLAQQRRLDAAAPGAVVAGVRHRRPARRAQRQLRHGGGAARLGRAYVARRSTGALGDTQAQGLGRPRHQGADAAAVVQPVAVLPRQPGPRARALAQRRRRRRAAPARRSRARRADLVRQPLPQHHLDPDDQLRSVHVAVLQHRPDAARAAPS